MRKSKDFYTTQKLFTIYALVVEDQGDTLVFIWKTSSKNLKAVLRRHLRGEVSFTKGEFSKDASTGEPRIVPLEYVECTGSEAYQRVLCWYRIFNETRGLMTMNPMATDAQAYDMSPSTERMYRSLRPTVSVHNLLNGKDTPIPIEPESPPDPPPEREMSQMNIRVHIDDRDTFYHFCKANHMTQREGFMHLLTLSPLLSESEKQSASDRLLAEKTATIARQQQTIQELERKLKNKYRGMAADEKLKNALSNTKRFIRKYVDLILPPPKGAALRCLSFNEWDRTYGGFSSYPYPEAAGHAIVELESICYGKGSVPAIFLFAWDTATGKLIKLRYYDNQYAVGFSPKNEYALPGSRWFVGYAPTTDEAMGITFLYPLPAGFAIPQPHADTEDERPSLDDVIAEIEANGYH